MHAPAPLDSKPALQRHADEFVAPTSVVLELAGHTRHAVSFRNEPTSHGGRASVHSPAELVSNPELQRQADEFVAPAADVLAFAWHAWHAELFRNEPISHGESVAVHDRNAPAPLGSNLRKRRQKGSGVEGEGGGFRLRGSGFSDQDSGFGVSPG